MCQHSIGNLFSADSIGRPLAANQGENRKGSVAGGRKLVEFMITTDRSGDIGVTVRQGPDTGNGKDNIIARKSDLRHRLGHGVEQVIDFLIRAATVIRIVRADVRSPDEQPVPTHRINQAGAEILCFKIQHPPVKRGGKVRISHNDMRPFGAADHFPVEAQPLLYLVGPSAGDIEHKLGLDGKFLTANTIKQRQRAVSNTTCLDIGQRHRFGTIFLRVLNHFEHNPFWLRDQCVEILRHGLCPWCQLRHQLARPGARQH